MSSLLTTCSLAETVFNFDVSQWFLESLYTMTEHASHGCCVRIIHKYVLALLILFIFSVCFMFCMRAFDLFGYWKDFLCFCLFILLRICSRSSFGLLLSVGWRHGTWNTLCCNTNSLNRHWRTSLMLPSPLPCRIVQIPPQKLSFVFDYRLYWSKNAIYTPRAIVLFRRALPCIPWPVWMLPVRHVVLISTARGVFILLFCFFFCLHTAMFRSARASGILYHSLHCLSRFYPGVEQAVWVRMWRNSLRLPAVSNCSLHALGSYWLLQ